MPNLPSEVDQLADTFWDRFLALSPVTATLYGDDRYDDILPDPGPAGRAQTRELATWVTDAARAISPDGLSVEERITRDMLIVLGELFVEEDDRRVDVLQAVDQMGGPQTFLPQLATLQPTNTPERLAKFEARLHAYPAYMAAHVELVREALDNGLTAPRIVAERVVAQMERMLATPAEQSPVPMILGGLPEADRERIIAIIRDEVMPA
ncbi:MAG TPA: DUF885 family protein, partial [Candidatus Limnocylindrales bacterium]|nr:DUF885 family protein [Candidatus Limnocylindrales bacterium]